MGLFSDIISAITGEGSSNVSTDSKGTTYSVNDDGDARVRNTSVIVDHDKGSHDTFWSTTDYNGQTGESKYSEGGHGANFSK